MKKGIIGCWILLACLCLASPDATAANRALIVAIGPAYGAHGLPPIRGPQMDVALAKDVARQMGFAESEVRVVREADAGKAAVLAGLDWVREGTRNGGKAFVYYSGHGTQTPGPNAGGPATCHQAIVPVDGNAPEKFITDDEIARYLKTMDGAEIVVFLVDSCFSGMVAKGVFGGSLDDAKVLPGGDQVCGEAVNAKNLVAPPQDGPVTRNLVALSATASNEIAYGDLTGTGKGSLFTQAFYDVLRGTGKPLSFKAVRDETAKRIDEICRTAQKIPHRPMLSGNPQLFDKDVRLSGAALPSGGGVQQADTNRELFDRLVQNSKFSVVIKADRNTVKLKEKLTFSVVSTRDGYLNLVELQPDGRVNVIFPNAYITTGSVAGRKEIHIPGDVGGFEFVGSEPAGKSQMVALVTRQPLNLYADRNLGAALGAFKSVAPDELGTLKEAVTRSLAVEPAGDDRKDYGAASLTFETVR